MRNRRERFYSSVDAHREADHKKEYTKAQIKRKESPTTKFLRNNIPISRNSSQPALEYRLNVLHGFGGA